ncbi:MAG: tetratricopeptide repeat protein [Candidatus Binatia bacterium]|nr:tetratricopeptide repeat protein [Candidatus Binatia bacterium]
MSFVVPRCAAALACALLAGFGGAAVYAQSASEIQAEVRRAIAHWPAGQPPAEPAALQAAVERLGPAALQFIALMDRGIQSGTEGKDRATLLEAYRTVSQPLEAIYEKTGGQLERMVKRVIEEDGDLEALYDSPEYRQGQAIGAQALYYLNWVRFYGARLFDGAQRKALLEKAASGFASFLGGEKTTDLQRESLLGRGLCALELGEFDAAIEDLQAVADDPQNPPDRRLKARLALLDGLVRNGRYAEAVKVSAALAGPDSGDPRALFLRARALLELAKKSAGPDGERQRKEAVALLERVRRAGGAWEERAQQLLLASVDDPTKYAQDATSPRARLELVKMMLQRKEFTQAVRTLEDMAKGTQLSPALDAERRYLLGLAYFQLGSWEAAARELEQALTLQRKEDAAEAAYLRFKAREKLAADKPEAADTPEYERALRDYVERFPQHRFAYEAYFRLGELLQRRQQCAEALEYYRNVTGDAEFKLRARFGALQCRVALLGTRGRPSESAMQEVGEELRALSAELARAEEGKTMDKQALSSMRAKLVLLQAAWESWQPEPNWQAIAQMLDGFEQRYPQQAELVPAVVRLRLLALAELAQFPAAEQEAGRNGAKLLQQYGKEEVEQLAIKFIRKGTALRNAGDASADVAAQRVALQLYRALAEAGALNESGELTLTRLYENTGDLERAEQLYRRALEAKPNSLPLLRALARLVEARGRREEAVQLWKRYTEAARPGDAPWYEGQYQLARLDQENGATKAACARLQELKPAMPGLSDHELRARLDALYKSVCR